MLMADADDQPHPALLVARGADAAVERESPAVADDAAAHPVHFAARCLLVKIEDRRTLDRRTARQAEQVIDPVGPAQRLVGQVALPGADGGRFAGQPAEFAGQVLLLDVQGCPLRSALRENYTKTRGLSEPCCSSRKCDQALREPRLAASRSRRVVIVEESATPSTFSGRQ